MTLHVVSLFELHSSDGVDSGFQLRQRRRTFLAAGGILCSKRQPDITCVPLEHGRTWCSVGVLGRERRGILGCRK